MKTTLDLQDELPARAKRYAKKTGCPLRKVTEDGLREGLAVRMPRRRYRLPDSSVGNADAADPFEARSWPDLRGVITERRSGSTVIAVDTNLPVHAHHRESRLHEPAHALVRALAEGGGVGDPLAVLLRILRRA